MSGFVLKIKTKDGQHIVSNLSTGETIGKLKLQIAELTNIPADCLNIKNGFPPKPLDLSSNDESISTSGIRNGDTLIVEQGKVSSSNDAAAPIVTDVAPVQPKNSLQIEEDTAVAKIFAAEEDGTNVHTSGILLKQVVPSDNSCLFTSIGEFKYLRIIYMLRRSIRTF